MSDEIRVTATRRESIDLDSLGMALHDVVESLDARTRKQLAAKGRKLLEAAEAKQSQTTGKESAA
jgi:hypothetical protein